MKNPEYILSKDATPQSLIFEALGAASVCWESMAGTGLFNEARARAIGEELVERLGVSE